MATDGAPAPATPPNPHRRRDFFIGLGLGLIPGILVIIAFSPDFYAMYYPLSSAPPAFVSGMLGAAAILYFVGLIAMIVLFSDRRTHSLGIGMLVSLVIDPVIYVVVFAVIYPYPN